MFFGRLPWASPKQWGLQGTKAFPLYGPEILVRGCEYISKTVADCAKQHEGKQWVWDSITRWQKEVTDPPLEEKKLQLRPASKMQRISAGTGRSKWRKGRSSGEQKGSWCVWGGVLF